MSKGSSLPYPDGVPINALERLIASLNMETFPTDLYAAADDIIVYSLFANFFHTEP
jgi:hypothetical protein